MNPTLNPNARLLVAELRKTPEERGYRQGRGQLHRASDNARCCLGVACELYQREVGGLKVEKTDETVFYNSKSGMLPEEVRDWLGFTDTGGEYEEYSLYKLNDNDASFRQIADIIERKPDGLFVEGK